MLEIEISCIFSLGLYHAKIVEAGKPTHTIPGFFGTEGQAVHAARACARRMGVYPKRVPLDPADTEPTFPLRASDDFAMRTVQQYRLLCVRYGLHCQADEVGKALTEIGIWREGHAEQCHLPDHQHVPIGG